MEYPVLTDLTKDSQRNFHQWTELLRKAKLNAKDFNAYWLQFDPIQPLNGALFGTFMIVVCVASLIGNFMIVLHSLK